MPPDSLIINGYSNWRALIILIFTFFFSRLVHFSPFTLCAICALFKLTELHQVKRLGAYLHLLAQFAPVAVVVRLPKIRKCQRFVNNF